MPDLSEIAKHVCLGLACVALAWFSWQACVIASERKRRKRQDG